MKERGPSVGCGVEVANRSEHECVAVDPVLEANARLNIRIRDGDETLRPWKDRFQGWQVNLPEEERDPIEEESAWTADEKAYSTSYRSSTARLRVTWEASFAMTGYFTTSTSSTVTCKGTTKCWTRTSSTPGSTLSYYAVWDYNNNTVGYIDYDEAAWDTMTSNYTSGNASCAQSGYSLSTTCNQSSSIGVGSGKDYTLQSGDGTGTGSGTGGYNSSTATKPRGGFCKAFQNLVLYRSGQYNSGTWRTLPTDATISGYSTSGSDAPTTSTSNIAVGDVLRQLTNLHSMIIVAYDSSTQQALVVDSNYVAPTTGSGYYEYIGSHVVGFSMTTFTSTYTRLGNYRNLKCVYTGSC